MRETKIKDETYLSLFHHSEKLKVRETQSMTFKEGNSGPFYLSAEERESRKFDCETDKITTKKHTRPFLIDKIKEKTRPKQVHGNLEEVQKLASNLNIPTEYTTNKIIEGWHNKPKGMLQKLWERGFLDPLKSNKELITIYNKDFKIDKATKEKICGMSLKEMVQTLPDFQNKLTLLQYCAQQLGFTVNCSPKFHLEIA